MSPFAMRGFSYRRVDIGVIATDPRMLCSHGRECILKNTLGKPVQLSDHQ
jgi:hypothetical protein